MSYTANDTSVRSTIRQPKDIECWGHRGASAYLPENTLASFSAAIAEGCDGIESDVHATLDGVVLMFHDPSLGRTTNGSGLIKDQPWKGVIEHVRTIKEPVQPIPLFEELIALLMEPGNRHVTLNIDCKMQNDPKRLFPEMSRIISQYENHETELCPRIILGLWHPLFIHSAIKYLPNCRRFHIGFSIPIAKTFFWDVCDGFSMCFPLLMGTGGQAFIQECREKGKEVTVWTVNNETEMRVAMLWGVKAVLTDRVGTFVNLRKEIIQHPDKLALQGIEKYTFPWSHWRYYSAAQVTFCFLFKLYLKAHGSLNLSLDFSACESSSPLLPPPQLAPDYPLCDRAIASSPTLTDKSTATPASGIIHNILPNDPS
nr:glycerophosphoryl diester phosphodiesterase [Cryptococcus depauperatus CBS 7841]